jgi:hypothetical protein
MTAIRIAVASTPLTATLNGGTYGTALGSFRAGRCVNAGRTIAGSLDEVVEVLDSWRA